MKKLLSYILVTCLFVAIYGVPAYSQDTDTGYETGQTFDWAPYYSSINVDERAVLFNFCYDIKWDVIGASSVNNLLDPPNFWDYYTMECSDTDPGDLGGTTGVTQIYQLERGNQRMITGTGLMRKLNILGLTKASLQTIPMLLSPSL